MNEQDRSPELEETSQVTKSLAKKRTEKGRDWSEMVRVSKEVQQKAGTQLRSLLSEFLVCPLSKQPLRHCEESNSLISDAVGVSFPIKNGVPCLVPGDGKILEEEDASKPDNHTNLSAVNEENQRRSS